MDISLYEILEVSPNASGPVIKAAYRCLAQQYHPDKNFGDAASAERLSLINQAYSVLADPLLRARYDQKVLGRGADRRGTGRAPAATERRSTVAEAKVRPFGFRRFQ